jgi:8-oxo-dGTP pyrophosphatase MutT (NUDIX family)
LNTLSAAWLRQRFSEATPVQSPSEQAPTDRPLTPAAVLIPVILRPELTILLTLRTSHLRDHAGQVSFPGGRIEPTDASPVHAAVREAGEEVGLASEQIEVLGCLGEFRTSTGFVVTPVVGLVTPPLNLKLDDFEVEDVFEPPLEFLLDAGNFRRERVEYQGRMREFWAVPWQERYIWGATAGMLVNLREFLFAGM